MRYFVVTVRSFFFSIRYFVVRVRVTVTVTVTVAVTRF